VSEETRSKHLKMEKIKDKKDMSLKIEDKAKPSSSDILTIITQSMKTYKKAEVGECQDWRGGAGDG